jgi:uncharacterized membrane protein
LPVTLLPFVTQLMGSIRHDWRVVLVFAAANLFAALMVELQWALVAARPETHKDENRPRLAQRIRWGTRFFAAVLTTGVLVSLLDFKVGILIILLMPFIYFLNFFRDPLGSRARPQSQDRGD